MSIRRIVLGLAACALAAAATAQPVPSERPPSVPPWQSASPWPDRIVVTLAGDPATSFAVTWRTDAGVGAAQAQIALATDDTRFDLAATTVNAVTETLDLGVKRAGGRDQPIDWNPGLPPVAYHSVTFTGLTPDTLYAYRVMGAEGHWSEWFHTRTAPGGAAPFRFLYLGDAQEGLRSHWARVIRAAFAAAPDARFVVHAGDLVNYGSRDFEWAEWFAATGFIHGMIPAVPVVGNHEYFDRGNGRPVSGLSIHWRPQFTLPRHPDLPDAVRETVYAVRYNDALIVVLDTMAAEHFEAQARWLAATLASSDARWHIVTTHHPMFDLVERPVIPGVEDTGPERRRLFLPLFVEHSVDLVLQGHDHAYGRGAVSAVAGKDGRGGDVDVGPVFVTSSSGAKMYEIAAVGWDGFAAEGVKLERRAENTPLFQVVEIDGDSLVYSARTASGKVYDAFRLDKLRGAPNRFTALPTDYPAGRSFADTGPYRSEPLDVLPPRP